MGKTHRAVVTHLEMRENAHVKHPLPRGHFALIRAVKPPVHFYRYLYNTIGADYVWVNRKRLDDTALAKIIHDDNVDIYVLHAEGIPAGFIELDFRRMPLTELSFLGVMPEFIGTGLGRYLLAEAVDLAWARHPERLIVQTCTLDHPSALPMYQRHGFTPYAQEDVVLEEVD